jgi:PAS domain-containing protein
LPAPFALRLQVVNLLAGHAKIEQGLMATNKTLEELKKELVEMRQKFLELQSCRMEFQNIQRRYEHLLQSAPDAMIFVNSQAKIIRVNAQLGNLFAYAEEDCLARTSTS